MKKKYKVTVIRKCVQSLEIEVDADSREKAEEIALEMAPSVDFSGREKEAEYEVQR